MSTGAHMLRTQMGCGRVAVQNRCVGGTWAGCAVAQGGGTTVIETRAAADFVGVPGRRGGVEIGRGEDGGGHRAVDAAAGQAVGQV